MKKRITSLVAIASAASFSGCATTKAEDVKIYSPAELKQGEYDTVARIWVESWRTALWVPTYSTRDDGIEALKDKAASLDANGLTNVGCYGDSGLFGGSEAFTCYGKAIKVRLTSRAEAPSAEKIASVESRLKKIIVEQLGISPEQVVPTARFVDDLGADSLDTVELVMAVEEEFGVEISDEQARKIVTVEDAVAYLATASRP